MLDGGRWGGRQVIAGEWVRKATTPIAENPGYGLPWWLESDPTVYAARGHLNTDCYGIPELDPVIARMQRHPRKDATARYGTPTRLTPELKALYRAIVRKPE